jgi:hypothetical protein
MEVCLVNESVSYGRMRFFEMLSGYACHLHDIDNTYTPDMHDFTRVTLRRLERQPLV